MEVTRGSMTRAVFLTALVICSSGWRFASAEKASEPLKFTYYFHDKFNPPDATAVQVTSANGSLVGARAFGDIGVFDAPLRAGVEKDSALIGSAGGEFVYLKAINFVTFVHSLEFDNYAGTLSGSAMFNVSAPSWEVGISGGTGSFRGAEGFFTVSVAKPDRLGNVVKYDATLTLPMSIKE